MNNKTCSVYECNSRYYKERGIWIHKFPKDQKRRKLWEMERILSSQFGFLFTQYVQAYSSQHLLPVILTLRSKYQSSLVDWSSVLWQMSSHSFYMAPQTIYYIVSDGTHLQVNCQKLQTYLFTQIRNATACLQELDNPAAQEHRFTWVGALN